MKYPWLFSLAELRASIAWARAAVTLPPPGPVRLTADVADVLATAARAQMSAYRNLQ